MLLTRTKHRVVIDCGGAHVSVGVFSFGGQSREEDGAARRPQLEAYAREDFVCSSAHGAAWSAQVGAALETLVTKLGFGRARECRLAIPGLLTLTKLVKTPAVALEDLGQVLRFEAAQAIPFPLDKVAWGGVIARNEGEEMALLISAAKLDELEPLCAAAESARLLLTSCEPGGSALWRAFSREVHEPVLFVDIGARTTQVIIGGGGAPLYLRTLNFGGNAVTSLLAQTLGCDFAEAEAAKRRAAQSVDDAELPRESEALLRKAVEQAASAFAQKLSSELLLTRLAYLRQSGALSPTRVYLCGGGSALLGLREKFAETLSLPVSELPLPSAIKVSSRLLGAAPIAASDLYTLYGLALGAELSETQQLNLLPPSRRAVCEAKARCSRWLAAAALLALLPSPLLIQQRVAIAALRVQAVAVDAAAAPLVRRSVSNAQVQEKVNELRARIAALDSLNAQRESWLGFLTDLQERLTEVGDVWLERLHYNTQSADQVREMDSPASPSIDLGGWLLESERTDEALQRLFDGLQSSDFVQKIERERYDRSRAGLIRFEAKLLIAPEKPL